MKKTILSLVCAALAATVWGEGRTLQNLDKTGLALQGYDPVAFFTDHKPVKGDAQYPLRHDGALYLFASKAHRDSFKAEPAKYTPAFGGYCAYGVSKGKLVGVDVEAFQVVEGRLLLQYSKGVRDDFNRDPRGNLTRADANWPKLVDKQAP